jgi:hypothetical protein
MNQSPTSFFFANEPRRRSKRRASQFSLPGRTHKKNGRLSARFSVLTALFGSGLLIVLHQNFISLYIKNALWLEPGVTAPSPPSP